MGSCDRGEALGFERAAKLLGQTGQFGCVANGLLAFVQLKVASERALDLERFAPQVGGLRSLSFRLSQLAQPAEGWEVCRVSRGQQLELLALGGDVAALRASQALVRWSSA